MLMYSYPVYNDCCKKPAIVFAGIYMQGAEPPLLVATESKFEDIAVLLVTYGADLEKHDEVSF